MNGHEDRLFRKLINYNKNCVMSRFSGRKLGQEICGDSLPALIGNLMRLDFTSGRLAVSFIKLTLVTRRNITWYVQINLRPECLSPMNFVSLADTEIGSVETGNDVLSQSAGVGYVHTGAV